jgi:tetratricopeptide (TPR) repeat protein
VIAKLLFSIAIVLPVTAQETTWQERIESARMLVRAGKPADARAIADGVREAALAANAGDAVLAADRMLIYFARSAGDWPRVEELLNESLDALPRTDSPGETANLLSELAHARRAQGRLEEAVATLERATGYRGRLPLAAESARDFTTIGLLQLELKKVDDAKSWLLGAIQIWGQLMREDPETLGALEAMAALWRDDANYAEAEPLYERALRIRETWFGRKSAEVIGGLDNLAYCYFGSKKYEKAEPLYKRLLEVWDTTAGPDHPMIALTLDKMVTFYMTQERYAEAQPLADRAVQIRGKTLADSFRTSAALAARQEQGQRAVDLVTKAGQVTEMAGVPKPPVKILPAPKNAIPLIKGRPVKSAQ